jgi:hypothetical protein
VRSMTLVAAERVWAMVMRLFATNRKAPSLALAFGEIGSQRPAPCLVHENVRVGWAPFR